MRRRTTGNGAAMPTALQVPPPIDDGLDARRAWIRARETWRRQHAPDGGADGWISDTAAMCAELRRRWAVDPERRVRGRVVDRNGHGR